MKQIAKIYQMDLKNIVTNWVVLIVILGLAILPSLYAWFNIKASWDPYGQTQNLEVAVVNKDQGAKLRGQSLNAGNKIISSLENNNKIGWIFIDEAEAMRGVNHGDYYASIIIPEDFSTKIISVLTDQPEKAEIMYFVNEKINAIAPKITAKGASSIVEQVSKNFIEIANGEIFNIFNKIGAELEAEKPAIEELTQLIFRIETIFPTLNQTVADVVKDMNKVGVLISKGQENLVIIGQVAENSKIFVHQLSVWLDKGSEAINLIGPNIKNDLILLQETAATSEELSAVLLSSEIDPAIVKSATERTKNRIAFEAKAINRLTDLFNQLNQMTKENRLAFALEKTKQITTSLNQKLSLITDFQELINQGENVTSEQIGQLNQLTKTTSQHLEDIIGRYDTEILPQIQNVLVSAKEASNKASDILEVVEKEIPDIQKLLADVEKGFVSGNEELLKIQQRLPVIEKKLKGLADLIRRLEQEGTLEQLIDLLKNNAEKESAFFAEPVLLKEKKLFSIPNYGSAMSPFFTTLSLWVGALLLVSLLTVEIEGNKGDFKSYQIYFGRYLTFVTIAIFQALFVTLGDIYLLKTYVVDKLWFVLFGIALSIVFMLIVYTLVSVFGNVGKAMAIVLLVLQLAGSGGTFPIQVTGPFFQKIHPFLPFTYGISMMREAVGGILWDVIFFDILRMSVYIGLTLLLGLALKDVVNRIAAKLMKKAKGSKLIH